jgi:hypothetical protein
MKIDAFLAEQALAERNWTEVGALIIGYFKLGDVPFEIKCEVPRGKSACKAVLVLVKEHRSYSFLTTDFSNNSPTFFPWDWNEPLSRDSNYLLIV